MAEPLLSGSGTDGPDGTTDRGEPAPRGRVATSLLFGVAWLAWFGMLQYSVVRFRVPIVVTLTVVTALLLVWVLSRVEIEVPAWLAVLVVLASLVITSTVPLFSYLRGGWLSAALWVTVVGGLVCAVLLALGPRLAGVAFAAAAALQVVLGAVAIRGDTAPRIDVWVILQEAADGLARGENMYTMTWVGSPGMKSEFTYLPWMSVLTAPGRWLFGDVRWALLAFTVLLSIGLWVMARPVGLGEATRRLPEVARRAGLAALTAAGIASMLAVAPGNLTQVDQAWTEPVLAALIVWWAVLVRRGHAWWAVVPLAVACASKQHLVLVVPLLVFWTAFGWRRVLATGALAGALVAPWLIADPAAIVHDTVTVLVSFPPLRFANTLYLYLLQERGITLPFAVTAAVMAAVVLLAVGAIWHRQPRVSEVLRWMALVLAVANLVNKQAFYNQYWLVAALVAASVVASAGERVERGAPPENELGTGLTENPGHRGVAAPVGG